MPTTPTKPSPAQRPSPRRTADSLIETARRALAAGDLGTVERLCQRLATEAPSDGRAWSLLCETALRRGRSDAALVCADRAVALAPDDALAHIMRARCRAMLGDIPGTWHATQSAVALGASAPEIEDALGALLGSLGCHDQALERFRRAVAARPDNAQFLFNLAATERMVGRLSEAEAHCDALLSRIPGHALAHSLRADLRLQTPERNHTAALEALLAQNQNPWQDRVILHYALAKEYEDLGLYPQSFHHVEAGAAVQRHQAPYAIAPDLAFIERITRTQTAGWLASVAGRGWSGAAPVFIVGLPRSGTTVVERILASHSALVSAGELGVFPVEVTRAFRTAPHALDLAALGRRTIEAAQTVLVPPGARFIDKTLNNFLYCGLIQAALPKAKIILVRRRPMDNGWALYKTHFQGTFGFSYSLTDLAAYTLAFRRLANHWITNLPPETITEVWYETIVRDPEAEARRLLAFLGLAWEEEVLRFHESRAPATTASAVQVRRPLYATSIGLWRHHQAGLAPLRERLALEIPEAELDLAE